MAKLAAAVDRLVARRAESGSPVHPETRVLASGRGWRVADVVCAYGPDDRAFEEQHSTFSIAVVAAGTFHYRSSIGRELMTPGALLLGSPGQSFECSHDHGTGDRCIAFFYEPEHFERIASAAGARRAQLAFPAVRVPPHRALAPIVARALVGVGTSDAAWEEIGTTLAASAVQVIDQVCAPPIPAPAASAARVARIVRTIDRHPDAPLDLARLARAAGLSVYHFLRTFEQVAGITPHQYVLRARLREPARLLATEQRPVQDIALDSGFGDLSNFNRAFRAEFGLAPRAFRGRHLRHASR